MKYYELINLKTVIFGAGKIAEGLERFLTESGSKGRLLGAWFTDIGDLNEVFILRGFKDYDCLLQERDRIRLSPDPFYAGDALLSYSIDSYKPVDFLPSVEPGEFGKVYELRVYQPTLDGLQPTLDKWTEAVPPRVEYSPLTMAMYSIDGPTRFAQIWPYESANHRSEIRGKTVADGVWPPKGGPDFLRPNMTSTMMVPIGFSPLK